MGVGFSKYLRKYLDKSKKLILEIKILVLKNRIN